MPLFTCPYMYDCIFMYYKQNNFRCRAIYDDLKKKIVYISYQLCSLRLNKINS